MEGGDLLTYLENVQKIVQESVQRIVQESVQKSVYSLGYGG